MTKNVLVAIDTPTKKIGDLRKHFSELYQNGTHKLVNADGKEQLPVSDGLFKVLMEIIPLLENGRTTVTISPSNAEMTTQQAADTLNVSRPYLIKLLESGEIPYVKTGSHRRIKVKDVIAYKEKREEQRSESLSDLRDIMEEYGLFN